MADWNLPATTTTYVNVLANLKDRDLDAAKMFDGVTVTNPATGMIRWSSANARLEKWSGSAWVALAATHAISISGSSASCTGNAATATALATARTINGVSFNGSANITVADATKLPLTGGAMSGSASWANVGPSTWARGLEARLADSTLKAGIGFLGDGDSITYAYIGVGIGPWSSTPGIRVSDAGITILGTVTGLTGNLAGNATSATTAAACTGNAATATKLATARTINGVSFDGSANITIPTSPPVPGTLSGTAIAWGTNAKWHATVSANTTFSFSSNPAVGTTCLLHVTHTSGTIAFPAAWVWPGDVAPSLTTGRVHIFAAYWDGAKYRASYLRNYPM